MTEALHDLWLQLSPPLPSSFASINNSKTRFTWKMAVKPERHRKKLAICTLSLILLTMLITATELPAEQYSEYKLN